MTARTRTIRMPGSRPGCAAGTWLDMLERPARTGGIVAPGAVTIHMTIPPQLPPAFLVDEAFAAGRRFERRRR